MENKDISIKKDQLEQAFKEMMDNIEDGNLKTMVRSKFAKFKNDFDGKRVEYCFNRFISAELDFQTAGDRGIGRISKWVPRLGGYYRKQLLQIDQGKMEALYNHIQDIMLKAYLTGVLMLSEELEDTVVTNDEELFEKWIPNIYVTSFDALGPGLQKALIAFCDLSLEGLQNFLKINKIEKKGVFKRYKIDEIISYYVVAGCGLRITETGK